MGRGGKKMQGFSSFSAHSALYPRLFVKAAGSLNEGEEKTTTQVSDDKINGDYSSRNIVLLQPRDSVYAREKYLAEQKALREGNNPERKIFLSGLSNEKSFGFGGPNARLTQPDAMLSGVMGWDWAKSSGKVEPGSRVFLRRNGTPGEIAGYFDVAEKIEVVLPPLEESEGPRFQAVLDDIWNKISPDMDTQFYPHERFASNLKEDCVEGKESKLYFTKVSNPQKLEGYSRRDLMVNMKGIKSGTAMTMGTSQMNGNSTAQKRNPERSEDLMRSGEENDANIVERNNGVYPG